ncbi:MAG: DapH/DapD/GlmU-related protein [Methylotenera sp.]|nr:DapH/DapD/GlmU-related protein [Methylotenera sp.]MDO9389347.1 DapH/DapD/GlmU-related protein [Methylotenera sp.]
MNSVFIHPTANVSESSLIGEGTKVWVNVQIRENAEIGNSCIISKDVYIDHGVKIGNHCKIQNSVSIYNGVTIEDDVFVGPNVAFTNDKVPRAFNTEWKITPTLVEKGSSIGANSTVVCGVVIGSYSMIAAGSVVTKNVPKHALMMGNPSKVVGYVCECGHRLDYQNKCTVCGKITNINGSGEVI